MITYSSAFLELTRDKLLYKCIFVYLLMADGIPLYVGSTKNPAARFIHHQVGNCKDTRPLFDTYHNIKMHIVDACDNTIQTISHAIEAKWINSFSGRYTLVNSETYPNLLAQYQLHPEEFPNILDGTLITETPTRN